MKRIHTVEAQGFQFAGTAAFLLPHDYCACGFAQFLDAQPPCLVSDLCELKIENIATHLLDCASIDGSQNLLYSVRFLSNSGLRRIIVQRL